MYSKTTKMIQGGVSALIVIGASVMADEARIVDYQTLTKDLIIESGRSAQNAGNENAGAIRSLSSATRQFVPVSAGQHNSGSGRVALKVEFEYDSANLTTQARLQLDQLAQAMNSKSLQDYGFKLIGHTDAVGSDGYNLALSERRARAVVAYLHNAHQMPADRLYSEGRGERELAIPSRPRSGINRRVEVLNLGRR